MNTSVNVLERSVLQAGKTFLKIGQENARAYVIQNGEICAYLMQNNEKIEVARFGPGTIICEMALMIDEICALNYETLCTTTVITITRQDFQKKLSRVDKSIQTVLDHAIKKIQYYENLELNNAIKNAEIDGTALALTRNLTKGMTEDKKAQYEQAILPHINGLLKEIKNIKRA